MVSSPPGLEAVVVEQNLPEVGEEAVELLQNLLEEEGEEGEEHHQLQDRENQEQGLQESPPKNDIKETLSVKLSLIRIFFYKNQRKHLKHQN